MTKRNFDFGDKPLVQKAWDMARSHHSGIIRRYTNEPYIEHPERIVETLLRWGISQEDNLAAAFLHDCVEDPNSAGQHMPLEMIRDHLNGRVMGKVDWLTRRKRESVTDYTRRIARADPSTRCIKLADILDNCVGLSEKAPEYAAHYLPKKIEQATAISNGIATRIRNEVLTALNGDLKVLQRIYLDRQVEIEARERRIEEEFQAALLSVELDMSGVALF